MNEQIKGLKKYYINVSGQGKPIIKNIKGQLWTQKLNDHKDILVNLHTETCHGDMIACRNMRILKALWEEERGDLLHMAVMQ